ncbi:MAG: HAMP domain-containing histidine kinase [Lachnospiraceae bacterium]|nr:HAMP domain-containing histidine kinase [Lachnospiraceae bacterium]
MKIRYWLIGYTLMMLFVLGYLYSSFGAKTALKRDMVYYNEQRIWIEAALDKGIEHKQIEDTYNCQILFTEEENYEIYLQEALKKEALIVDYMQDNVLIGKIIWNEAEKHYVQLEAQLRKQSMIVWGWIFLCGYLLLIFVYYRVVRPFQKLEKFSKQVAKGNLDFPLPVTKHQYFGAFTESFDLMREELKRAKESEYQANKSKKELMAELSHDIKTPIATIQAACEVMQIKETNKDTLNKIGLINEKAKIIHALVDNLFHAALEELTVLKVEPVEESSVCIREMFLDLEYYGEIKLTGKLPECLVYMDKLRLQQVIDNCLHNAWKYAGTSVEVNFDEQKDGICIQIKDEGNGVLEEELPLILEKFYRGSNAKGKEGSGLGLYLAKLFMEQMKGDMDCYNDNGFVVQLFLRKV